MRRPRRRSGSRSRCRRWCRSRCPTRRCERTKRRSALGRSRRLRRSNGASYRQTNHRHTIRRHTNCRSVCTYPSYSPDGTRIAYRKVVDAPGFQWDLTSALRNSEVFVADIDGNNERNVSNSAAFDGWPVFTPDGAGVVFSSNRAGPARVGHWRPCATCAWRHDRRERARRRPVALPPPAADQRASQPRSGTD